MILKKIKNYLHIYILFAFFLFYFFYSYINFIDLEPRIDQARHISWLAHLKNSTNLFNFEKLNDSFIFNLLRVTGNSGDYHAYLFQINTILVIYFYSFIIDFFNTDIIYIYNFVSIFFSCAIIFLCYFLAEDILTNQKKKFNKIKLAIILCLLSFTYYKFYYSALGNHNISNFFFLMGIIILRKFFLEDKKIYYFYAGLLISFLGYFQITVAILLIPSFGIFILFNNFKKKEKCIKLCINYALGVLIGLIPFLLLILFTIFLGSGYAFGSLIGDNLSFFEYFNKIKIWFLNFYNLNGPLVVILFFLLFSKKDLLQDKIVQIFLIIISTHFILNFLLNIIIISYIRNYLYLHHIVIVLCSIIVLKYLNLPNINKKILIYAFVVFTIFFNINVILDFKKLYNIDSFFYNFYFLKNGTLKNQMENLTKTTVKNSKVIFYNQLSKDYFLIYNKKYFNLFYKQRPLVDRVVVLNSYNRINKFKASQQNFINDNVFLIAIENDENIINKTILNLKQKKNISQKCNLSRSLVNLPVLPDGGSSKFIKHLIVKKLNCE